MLSDTGLDLLFREARSFNSWSSQPVSDVELQAVYELMRWGPTSANCSPARVLFLRTDDAKERLKPHLGEGNIEKTMAAPVVAIIGYDLKFYDRIPELFPHNPAARDWFTGDEKAAEVTAFRNGTLQGAYLIMAARAVGLDCGPMSGFDNDGVDKEFFASGDGHADDRADNQGDIRSNFLCALGHGTREDLFPRSPRLAFDDACKIL